MKRERDLQSATAWQKRRRVTTERLSAGLGVYLDGRLSEFSKNAAVVDVWREILPAKFYEHCHLAGISKGVLRLEVDPGPYMHELELMKVELLAHLQRQCPRTGLKNIVLRARRQ